VFTEVVPDPVQLLRLPVSKPPFVSEVIVGGLTVNVSDAVCVFPPPLPVIVNA